mgnify:FL=1
MSEILQGSTLAEQPLAEMAILDTGEKAIAIEVNLANAITAWQTLHSLMKTTERYPVIVADFEERGNWSKAVERSKDEIFSRFPYDYECPESEENSPRSIINRAESLELAEVLQSYPEETYSSQEELQEEIERELSITEENYAIAPRVSEVMKALENKSPTLTEIERFLFHWENDHVEAEKLQDNVFLDYLDWYEPMSRMGILLLPIQNSWETLAYLSFFGAEGRGEAEKAMTVLKSWQQRFGAELVAHYGTMLEFIVQRVPTDAEAAFQLAWEQSAIAPCTVILPGVSLREHARALLQSQRWFLHERP